jgi:hypothetical protein
LYIHTYICLKDRALRAGLVLGALQDVEGAAFNNTTFESYVWQPKSNSYTQHSRRNYPSPQETWTHRRGRIPKIELTDRSTAVSSAI